MLISCAQSKYIFTVLSLHQHFCEICVYVCEVFNSNSELFLWQVKRLEGNSFFQAIISMIFTQLSHQEFNQLSHLLTEFATTIY